MSSLELVIDEKKLLRALTEQPHKLEVNLDNAISRILYTFANAGKDNAPKATSILVNSINVDRQGPLEGTVGPAVNYGQAVEEGTGIYGPAGQPSGKMPPIENIKDWIGVAGITPQRPGDDEDDLAWAIARSIAMGGTPSQPYMEPALEDNRAEADRLIDAAITASLR